jgi:thiosulfate reductase cytochrome b subunit
MVVFKPKIPIWENFCRALDWKMSIYFMAIWNIWDFYDHLVHFAFIWFIISGFGIMYQEKSGITGRYHHHRRNHSRKKIGSQKNLLQILDTVQNIQENTIIELN